MPVTEEIDAMTFLLIDKLGERLAFERTSVRLYEALLSKCRHSGLELPLAKLEMIQQQELEHFVMVKNALDEMGADPTVERPCADVTAIASSGLLQVVSDPRTSLAQALNAALTSELTDNAAWELLIQMCRQAGFEQTADIFGLALRQEAEHLDIIKSLIEQLTLQTV